MKRNRLREKYDEALTEGIDDKVITPVWSCFILTLYNPGARSP